MVQPAAVKVTRENSCLCTRAENGASLAQANAKAGTSSAAIAASKPMVRCCTARSPRIKVWRRACHTRGPRETSPKNTGRSSDWPGNRHCGRRSSRDADRAARTAGVATFESVAVATNPHLPSREQLIHLLYEAAELEHTLMCTYLYAAFSLRDGEAEGLSIDEAEAVTRWRRVIMKVAVEEMGHLTAVWNITAALGGAPRFGRGNFPLEPGTLPAGIVVKLAPFSEAVIQHFVHLERPRGSTEKEGAGFEPEHLFQRGVKDRVRLTPMALDYDTVGEFYETLESQLSAFVAHHGEAAAFVGDPALQLSPAELELAGAQPVICKKTALAALATIVTQGEGAPEHSDDSHYQKFSSVRREYAALKAKNPNFEPAHPAAHNPVLRPPVGRTGRVWIEDEEAAETVDLANTGYALMLRLLAYSYLAPRPMPEKVLAVDLSLGLMRAVTLWAERAVRLPAGPSNPHCNAGMSFRSEE